MLAWFELRRYLNWVTVQKTIAGVIESRLTGLAAEMAFSAMLGLFPAIIAVLTAIGFFEDSVESTLVSLAVHYADIVPIQVWTLLLEFIEEIRVAENKSWFSLSTLTAIWIISGVLSAAINALDQIHQVSVEHKRSYLETKIVAVSLTVFTIALLVVACFLLWIGDILLKVALQQNWHSLFLSTWRIFSVILVIAIVTTVSWLVYQFKTKLRRKSDQEFKTAVTTLLIILGTVAAQLVYAGYLTIQNLLARSPIELSFSSLLIDLWRWLGFPIALGIIAIAFSLIYRYGTSKRSKNTPVLPGAILAAISWAIVSLIFRLYVSHIGIYSRIYGTVGTAIILMLWLYLSSLVMLIGEQLNVVLGEAIRADKRNLRFYQRP
ncbi:MAG: YihY/virulence factor BrkB family protein [Cyanobacteria bacterium J06607_15]